MFIPLLANVEFVVNIVPQGNVFILLLHFHYANCHVPPIISLQIHHQWPNKILNLAPTTTGKKYATTTQKHKLYHKVVLLYIYCSIQRTLEAMPAAAWLVVGSFMPERF
jgi:hypothetical protein